MTYFDADKASRDSRNLEQYKTIVAVLVCNLIVGFAAGCFLSDCPLSAGRVTD